MLIHGARVWVHEVALVVQLTLGLREGWLAASMAAFK